jgi:hypothetical protein
LEKSLKFGAFTSFALRYEHMHLLPLSELLFDYTAVVPSAISDCGHLEVLADSMVSSFESINELCSKFW